VHAAMLKPFDERALVEPCGSAPFVVTVEEHSTYGGLGGLVAEVLSASGRPRPAHRGAPEDTWVESGSSAYLLDH
jgi:transketolase